MIEERISELVRNSELSYGEIARRCGVQRTTVSGWAKTGKISIGNFAALCHALRLNPIELLYGTECSSDTHELLPLQRKAMGMIQTLPEDKYYKLEEVIKILSE